MSMNCVPVTAALASDLVLGLDWFHFVHASAPETVVHLSDGRLLDLRQPLGLTTSVESDIPSLFGA